VGTCEQVDRHGREWKWMPDWKLINFWRDEREKNMRPSEAVWKKQFGKFEERKRESIKK